MKTNIFIPILFMMLSLQGCIGNQGSSKYISIFTERSIIVPNVAVEGTYVSYLGGVTYEGGSSIGWEGLINCQWITPVQTNPWSIELKYPMNNYRFFQNIRMRAIGSLHIIPKIGSSQPSLYLEVESLVRAY
jgi:hypothetical protein